ncbi:unnamed protein product [Pleuronectes platessa]|uniref:C2H2-type domain-containing protein n=1 Tax=Pleuronectes platessa TaxID=8262 RepID=A0A9N7VQ36_PLEPL|nr:unnamed protein product [Pleuronectes platessa]
MNLCPVCWEVGEFASSKWRHVWLIGGSPAGQRTFNCSYCPYSASQKGNLKTHVLCVHRMPFDNTQYPDRRFKRSRTELDIPYNSPDHVDGGVSSNQPMIEADGRHGSNVGPFTREASSCHHE